MPSMRGRAPKGTGTARVGGAHARAPLHGARGLGHLVWFGSRGPAPGWPFPCPHYPPLNRLPHSESPPFSFKSIHHLPSFTKAPNMCICFAEVFVGGIRGASATVSLSLLPRLACPHRRRPDTLRRNTSRAQRCRRAKPGYTWSPRKNR